MYSSVTGLAIGLLECPVVHEGDGFSFLDVGSIINLDSELIVPVLVGDSQSWVLLVYWDALDLELFWDTGDSDGRSLIVVNSVVLSSQLFHLLLVHGPDLVPLLQVGVSAWALVKHELNESLKHHTSSDDSLDGWESWVNPRVDDSFLDNGLEMSLTHDSVDEGKSRVLLDLDLLESELLKEPLVLTLSVIVFSGSHSMGNSLN